MRWGEGLFNPYRPFNVHMYQFSRRGQLNVINEDGKGFITDMNSEHYLQAQHASYPSINLGFDSVLAG